VGHKSRKLSEIGALACLLIGMTGAMGAQAQTLAALPAPSIPAAAAGVTRPVQAWTQMCERQPAECAVDTGEQPTIALTRQTWQLLVTVNAKVNTAVKPLTDDDHWGVADLWSLPEDGYGDCEDYQLLKRQLLVEAGFPRRALLMTVVIDEKGEGHAVLPRRGDLAGHDSEPLSLPFLLRHPATSPTIPSRPDIARRGQSPGLAPFSSLLVQGTCRNGMELSAYAAR
jgi:predicted transglutaminase-like cysteine proteinase